MRSIQLVSTVDTTSYTWNQGWTTGLCHRQRTSRIKNKGMVKYCRVIKSSPGGRPSSCELQSLLLYLTHICRWWQRGNMGKTARRVGGSPPTNQPQKKYTNGQNWRQWRWALSGYNIVGVTRRDCLLMSRCRWPWWGQNSPTSNGSNPPTASIPTLVQ